ncbi:hypothetical protein [Polyangium jinanense]|uniref:PEGA domain-containing protein n=1 Tax=Polyangium jinanense TaxID=2829994 RepID=A0A9X3X6B4_9BACT|nr:hypothetical protein [Polyangium jinanense]MDC3958037.1 hypothetical protein [Polyangium jinanense]MDC3983590.1 hypothetical protein [Polyangium jinanense]
MNTPVRSLFRGACFVAAPLALAIVIGGAAHADEKADKARAQQLFVEGRKAIEAGDKATGCAKMRESMGLFAVANTLFNVAQCDEGEGKIAGALEHWERGLALIDAKDPRAKVAKERINALSPRVPRLRIVVPPGQPVSAVVLDGTELSPTTLSAPLYVEPGSHTIVVRAEGRPDRKHELTLAEKERTEFVATPAAPGPSGSSSANVVPTATASATGGGTPPPPSSFRRTAGFIVGGVGVAGLIAAGVTGGVIMSKASGFDACKKTRDDGGSCTIEQADVDTYNNLLVPNAVAWGVGIAGVGVGLVLVLTAPSSKEGEAGKASFVPVPIVVPGGGGMGLSGRF